jgi:hypothetical protein
MIYEPRAVRLTLEELKALCADWQKVLRIQDVAILLEIVPMDDIDCSWGRTWTREDLYHATINIAHPDSIGTTKWLYDMEKTLVHELVHVAMHMKAKELDPSEEGGVERISEAMVGMKRAVKP